MPPYHDACAQLTVLSQGFPRHIVEFFTLMDSVNIAKDMGRLARSHTDVTVLFMDIAGRFRVASWVNLRV
eukprot:365467-Chlamydomonas_euryale.AAC.30